MALFNKLKFGNTRNVHRHTGKGAREARLPDRAALNDLTGGGKNPTINDYAKASPEPQDAPGMTTMGSGSPGLADDY